MIPTILYSIILYYIILHYVILCYIILYYTILYLTILYWSNYITCNTTVYVLPPKVFGKDIFFFAVSFIFSSDLAWSFSLIWGSKLAWVQTWAVSSGSRAFRTHPHSKVWTCSHSVSSVDTCALYIELMCIYLQYVQYNIILYTSTCIHICVFRYFDFRCRWRAAADAT